MGGFHTKECTAGQYTLIVDYFRKLNPKSIGVCHCTGINKYADLQADFPGIVFYNYCGNEVIV